MTAACFIGFTGFTLVMPFLPLYFQQLGVTDVGAIAMWSGLSLGVTPALTALLSPFWGRLADRYGRKIMVERSLISFIFLMGAMAFVKHPWQVFALRAAQGLFAGYGSLTLTMAADSAPRDRVAYSIGFVQTAQRLGPAVGPIVGSAVAQVVGLRYAFLVTAGFYVVALVLVFVMYDERTAPHHVAAASAARVTFKNVLAFQNFILLMVVIFGLQFVDRSFGPVLPLYIAQLGHGTVRACRWYRVSFFRLRRRPVPSGIMSAACSSPVGLRVASSPSPSRVAAAGTTDLSPCGCFMDSPGRNARIRSCHR